MRDDLGKPRVHVGAERAVILSEAANVIADFLQDRHGDVRHEDT